jgi:hypothetical protein
VARLVVRDVLRRVASALLGPDVLDMPGTRRVRLEMTLVHEVGVLVVAMLEDLRKPDARIRYTVQSAPRSLPVPGLDVVVQAEWAL